MDSALSVGLECEIKIAFEASELLQANPEIKNLQIIKEHGPVQGRRAAVSTYRLKKYENWVLYDAANPECAEETSLQVFGDASQICNFRMYKDEPLKVVQHALFNAGIHSTVHSDLTAKQQDYTQAPWSIQRDASLQGLTAEQKTAAFPTTITSIEEAKEVDCYGVELVTWPLTSADSARDNITNAANSLRASLKHGYIINHETALHAHVGHVNGTPFSLPLLQNLFLIVVLFEDELSLLHSIARRRGSENEEIESNRVEFLAEGADEVLRMVPDTEDPSSLVSKNFFQNYKTTAEIEQLIFDEVNNARDSKARFRQLSGDKRHAVNFSYCFRDRTNGEAAATVEFRQHDGSLDGEEVFHWYQHCEALVALAQRYAREGTTITQRLGIANWDSRIKIEDLWEEMQLSQESRAFYTARIERLSAQDPTWAPNPPIFDLADFNEFDELDSEEEGWTGEEENALSLVTTMESSVGSECSSSDGALADLVKDVSI